MMYTSTHRIKGTMSKYRSWALILFTSGHRRVLKNKTKLEKHTRIHIITHRYRYTHMCAYIKYHGLKTYNQNVYKYVHMYGHTPLTSVY